MCARVDGNRVAYTVYILSEGTGETEWHDSSKLNEIIYFFVIRLQLFSMLVATARSIRHFCEHRCSCFHSRRGSRCIILYYNVWLQHPPPPTTTAFALARHVYYLWGRIAEFSRIKIKNSLRAPRDIFVIYVIDTHSAGENYIAKYNT